ncbi:hypothetical protein GOQ30_02480 [Flavobacterium sp. TP390]|uniref:Uncharacterized protein n=1 Tax=Flavobacterium profundi TaxID=1774945 RepID=A0A6I4IK00_9FLAO|nr:hypothetical protein [Flavobacterium profundi]MVO08032.1 hypothetical protein [Flavobacterium profundi]
MAATSTGGILSLTFKTNAYAIKKMEYSKVENKAKKIGTNHSNLWQKKAKRKKSVEICQISVICVPKPRAKRTKPIAYAIKKTWFDFRTFDFCLSTFDSKKSPLA